MTETIRNTWPSSPWRAAMWAAALALLLLPWVAMQFTAEVDWTPGDFTIFGVMLLGACGAMELGARMNGHLAYRTGVAVAVAAGFLLVWVNLAVGIVGSEHNPANLMFAGVLLVPAIGALAARFRAPGMVRALTATAAAQAIAAGAVLWLGHGYEALLTCFFVALWAVSALLFRWAASARR